LSGGDLIQPISVDFTDVPGGPVFGSNPQGVKFLIDSKTDILTGSFTNPVTSLLTPFKGIVLQAQTNAYGYFISTNKTGAFTIRGR